MDNNRIQADMVEEGQGRREGLEVFGNNGTADLDDGELLGRNGGEVGEVLLDFSLRANIAQQLDDGRASRGELRVGGTGIATGLQQGGGRGLQRVTGDRRGESSGRDGLRCGERREEGLGGSSPHSGAKEQHFGNQHAAASNGNGRVTIGR